MTPNPGQNITGRSPQAKGVLPRHLMTDKEKAAEWIRYWRVCGLKMNALCAALDTDGTKVLQMVLQELGLERSEDLVKEIAKHVQENPRPHK